MMRAVHGSTVLYPSDATSTAALVDAMAATPGISYLRTTRGAYPVLYGAGEDFPVGGSKMLRSGEHDEVTLVGAGVTLHACLRAADMLDEEGIAARVIDCYSVKPIDTATLARRGRPPAGGSWSPRTTTPKAGSARRSPKPARRRAARPCRRSPRRPRHARLRHRRRALGLGRHRRGPHRRRRPPAGRQQMMSHHDPWPDRPEPTW